MPLYEYECNACRHRFEVIQKFSDPPVEQCPVCEGGVRKLVSSPAIQFKGSGWYITDYARKAESGGRKSGEGATDGASTKDAKPSESAAKEASQSTTDAKPTAAASSSSKSSSPEG